MNDEDKPTCEHEHSTDMLLSGTFNKTWRSSERQYEVYYCKDCNRLINMFGSASGDCAMNAEEITLMFGDVARMTNDVYAVFAEAQDTLNALSKVFEK